MRWNFLYYGEHLISPELGGIYAMSWVYESKDEET